MDVRFRLFPLHFVYSTPLLLKSTRAACHIFNPSFDGERLHVFNSGINWFKQVTDPQDGRVGYNAMGTGKVFVPGKNENYNDHRTLTAAAWLCRIQMGQETGALVRSAVQSVYMDLPKSSGNDLDYYYWYYGTRFSKVAFESKEENVWKAALLKSLNATQEMDTKECRRGSWGPYDRWACEAGRVYSTAINCLTMEYAVLNKAFDYSAAPKGGSGNAEKSFQWIFKLKSGGRVLAYSYEDLVEGYLILVAQGTVRFSKSEVESITKYRPGDESVDLIKLIDTTKDTVQGEWSSNGKTLICSRKVPGSRIQIPYLPPDEYDLQLIVERREGAEAINIGLACSLAQFAVVLDGDPSNGFASGIGLLDGNMYNENETVMKGPVLSNGKPSTILCSVRKSGVIVLVDGRKIIDWKGNFNRLSNYSEVRVPNARTLFLVNWDCRFQINKASLTPISGQGKNLR